MSFASVWQDIDEHNRAIAQAETWGHLAPEQGRTYSGSILFAHGEYGDSIPVSVDFPDLPDSPWFYEGLTDYILDHCSAETTGKVYRFTGTYRLDVWPDVFDDAGDEYIQRAGHRHVFDGQIVTIPEPGEEH